MLGHTFYHRLIRKYVTAFGTLFNDITIERRNKSNVVIEQIKVPISFSSKQKFFEILDKDNSKNKETQITLPRLGFEITGYSYNPETKLNNLQKYKVTNPADNSTFITAYTHVPYDIQFTLNAFVKNTEDGTQIAEQIIPFFAPDFVVTLNLIDEINNPFDIPVILNSVSNTDDFEGEFDNKRIITWEFTFTMKALFIGPVSANGKPINNVNINTSTLSNEFNSTLNTVPTVDGKTTEEILATDDFGFLTTITN